MRFQFTVILSIYYSTEPINRICAVMKELHNAPLLIIVLPFDLYQQVPKQYLRLATFIISTNKGKDIGSKLLGIYYLIKNKISTEFLVLLHDKKSLHKQSGAFEKEILWRIVGSNEYISQCIQVLKDDPKTGLVCASEAIKNEFKNNSFQTTNNSIIQSELKTYLPNLKNHAFCAGTMFWTRFAPFELFFSLHSPLLIRKKLEPGNPLDHNSGTFTHTWERMLSWITTSHNLNIYGI